MTTVTTTYQVKTYAQEKYDAPDVPVHVISNGYHLRAILGVEDQYSPDLLFERIPLGWQVHVHPEEGDPAGRLTIFDDGCGVVWEEKDGRHPDPVIIDALDAADTLCAVANLDDINPQCRAALKEAWAMVNEAKSRLDGKHNTFAEVNPEVVNGVPRDRVEKAFSAAFDLAKELGVTICVPEYACTEWKDAIQAGDLSFYKEA